jgi:hypothetical protein
MHGLEDQKPGLDQGPHQEKYAFPSITWVPLPQMKHMRACLQGLYARIIKASCGADHGHDYSPIQPNFQISNIRRDGTL